MTKELTTHMKIEFDWYKSFDRIILLEDFIQDLPIKMKEFYNNYELEYSECNSSFYKTFKSNGFSKKQVNDITTDDFPLVSEEELCLYKSGEYFTDNEELTYGYGGFNPCQKISWDRLNSWQDKMDKNTKNVIFNSLKAKLGLDLATAFLENNTLKTKDILERKYGR